jgi:hypothetical protein
MNVIVRVLLKQPDTMPFAAAPGMGVYPKLKLFFSQFIDKTITCPLCHGLALTAHPPGAHILAPAREARVTALPHTQTLCAQRARQPFHDNPAQHGHPGPHPDSLLSPSFL